ncbi:MAG TPA: DcaP family trimeric outer membrane transporter [Pyrinomonadaceae bacterium]|nr:DcaP family trimeric outer membrane transporter [Pyrinomonadaceae bacterium]
MTRAAGAALLAGILVSGSRPARAQSPQGEPTQSPAVEQLKDKVKQLEQTVEELKGQIKAIENTQKEAAARQSTSTPVGEAIAAGAPAPVPGGPPAPKQEEKKVGGTFEVYGFAMLDMGYQGGQSHPDWFDVIRVTKLPAFKDEFGSNGATFAGVRQTRFGARSSTPTKYGELKTLFEFELFGTGVDAGQTTFRLRHAYGELGQFGAGQTNSPFMDGDVFPNSLEYWGPTGMVFFRNVQARWMPIKGRSRVTVALERPGASGDQGVFADRIELAGIKPKFGWPDLSWEARLGRDWGYVEAAGIFRSIRWVDTNDDAFDLGGSDVGWGINLSSNLNFGKNDVGRFQVVYGQGIQNYMNDSPVDIGPEFNPGGDPRKPIKGVALPVLGVVAFLDHTWNKKFSSAGGYSMQNIENSDAQAPSAFRQGHYALGNLLYYPTEKTMVGGEFQFGRRENNSDGFTVNDYRMQFSFKYNFSKVFEF